jgi:hypothetical protein
MRGDIWGQQDMPAQGRTLYGQDTQPLGSGLYHQSEPLRHALDLTLPLWVT